MKNVIDQNVSHAKFSACMKKRDYAMALIYIMNAIAHDPKLTYLSDYVMLLKKMGPSHEEIDKALGILSTAAVNGNADDVVEICKLIESLNEFAAKLNAVDATDGEEYTSDAIVNELERFSWENLKRDGLMMSPDRLGEKTLALKEALESGVLGDEDAKRYTDELEQTQWQVAYVSITSTINGSLEKVNKLISEPNFNRPKVGAYMAQASNALSQFWLLEADGPIRSDVLQRHQCELQSYFERIDRQVQSAISQLIWDECLQKIGNCCGGKKTITSRINCIQINLGVIQDYLLRITDQECRGLAQEKARELTEQLTELSRQRFSKYQADVADRSLAMVKDYDDGNFVCDAKEKVMAIFKKHRTSWVDETLLSPECASLFQSAKSMLLAKLNKVEKATYECECAKHEKDRLEQY